MDSLASMEWFSVKRIHDRLFLIDEPHFAESNRCNIWLVKGPTTDVIIDTGLGVCNLKNFLEDKGLIDPPGVARDCIVICTHVHFDHCGGAHHFEKVYIHEDEVDALQQARVPETLNYVRQTDFHRLPYVGFSASKYKVPPTNCSGLKHDDDIDLGDGHSLKVMHFPGHTRGSIILYYPQTKDVFTGDTVYESGNGSYLLDWLPNSSVRMYIQSARQLRSWIEQSEITRVCPGHFQIMSPARTLQLLNQYVNARSGVLCRCGLHCMQGLAKLYFSCK